MDWNVIAGVKRRIADGQSRRQTIRALSCGALAAVLGLLGLAEVAAGTAPCKVNPKKCAKNGQCCTGFCDKKGKCKEKNKRTGKVKLTGKCKCACPAEADACTAPPLLLCGDGPLPGLGDACTCVTGTEGTTICGQSGPAVACTACASDAECVQHTGPGSVCVQIDPTLCTCNPPSATACVPPCGAAPAAARSSGAGGLHLGR